MLVSCGHSDIATTNTFKERLSFIEQMPFMYVHNAYIICVYYFHDAFLNDFAIILFSYTNICIADLRDG